MSLINPRSWDRLSDNDVTPEQVYRQRRQFLKGLGFLGVASTISPAASAAWFSKDEPETAIKRRALTAKDIDPLHNDSLTPEAKATSHNNFYEFGTSKTDPAQNSREFSVSPWQLRVDGEVQQAKTIDVDQLINAASLEQRIYRLRCVEAWSMVIPWVGIPLASLLSSVNFLSSAKYLAFETLHDPKRMPGQAGRLGGGIDYPYVEGLRIDEAMHPLTFIAVGMYGKTLPAQNGAPLRLVVPWKYGFKSIKSIVRIRAVEQEPPTTWNRLAPHEYGFYANVNPQVDHPRWSQATERRIDDSSLLGRARIDTEAFNGYGEQVAGLYKGMDLHKYF